MAILGTRKQRMPEPVRLEVKELAIIFNIVNVRYSQYGILMYKCIETIVCVTLIEDWALLLIQRLVSLINSSIYRYLSV
jgi:hypothetical protein